jgi:Fe2+ or Zn2+ uptake regulation protein
MISRSTYFRRRGILKELNRGIAPPSKRPKRVRQPRWTRADSDLILKNRRENPTHGKAKIAVIMKRDHGSKLSESTVGRILKRLMESGLVTKSASAIRTKRKHIFKGHAQPWIFKKFEHMKVGERVQIDHMIGYEERICEQAFSVLGSEIEANSRANLLKCDGEISEEISRRIG